MSYEKKPKDISMNFRLPEQEYETMKEIADKLGMSLSGMMRAVIYDRLREYEKTKNPMSFLGKSSSEE